MLRMFPPMKFSGEAVSGFFEKKKFEVLLQQPEIACLHLYAFEILLLVRSYSAYFLLIWSTGYQVTGSLFFPYVKGSLHEDLQAALTSGCFCLVSQILTK